MGFLTSRVACIPSWKREKKACNSQYDQVQLQLNWKNQDKTTTAWKISFSILWILLHNGRILRCINIILNFCPIGGISVLWWSWYFFLFSIFFKVPFVSQYHFKFSCCCGFGIGFNFDQRSFGLTYFELAAPTFFSSKIRTNERGSRKMNKCHSWQYTLIPIAIHQGKLINGWVFSSLFPPYY